MCLKCSFVSTTTKWIFITKDNINHCYHKKSLPTLTAFCWLYIPTWCRSQNPRELRMPERCICSVEKAFCERHLFKINFKNQTDMQFKKSNSFTRKTDVPCPTHIFTPLRQALSSLFSYLFWHFSLYSSI